MEDRTLLIYGAHISANKIRQHYLRYVSSASTKVVVVSNQWLHNEDMVLGLKTFKKPTIDIRI